MNDSRMMGAPKMVKKRDLLELLKGRPGPCISLYMPTHRSAPESGQDPIRFKNLLSLIESDLISDGMRTSDANSLLERAHKLRNDDLFWSQQSDGLACFIAPGFFRIERVPLRIEPEHKISDRFHIKPLLPLVDAHGRFFILALSQNQADLYEATSHSLTHVPLDSIPKGVESLIPDRRVDATLQYHTSNPASQQQKSSTPVFHGHSIAAEKEQADILRYLREVDRIVYEVIREEAGPLVLACVGFLASLYESVNSYRHLMRAKVPGNPNSWSDQELHVKACEIAQTELSKPFRRSMLRYQEEYATPLTSSCVKEIVPAAHEGRVETLFATTDFDCLGRYDAGRRLVQIDNTEHGDDLIDLAAAKTIENGGTVFAVDGNADQNVKPKLEPLAAILRYAISSESNSSSMA